MVKFHWPGFDARRRLSVEESTELAARVAELTRAGLPLGDGLRALADELPGQRLPRVLCSLAGRLDAGDDLVSVLESHGRSLPTHLRGLMLAGIRSGRLAEVLEEFVDLERSQLELRRRVWLTLAYPFILLVFMAALAVVARVLVVNGFERIYKDFGTHLPGMTLVAIRTSGPMMWLFLGMVGFVVAIALVLWAAPGASWMWPALYRVPMLGPLLRWSHLSQFARLMGLLLEQDVALPDALRLSAAGVRNADLAQACHDVATDVEKGQVLYESIAAHRQFPASLVPVVEWGQRAPALADAFRASAEMFEGRVRSQGTLLESLLLPIMFLAIIAFVGAFVVAMFMPLIALIQKLS